MSYEEYSVHEICVSWRAEDQVKRLLEADWTGECRHKNAWDELDMTKLISQDQELWWSVLTTIWREGPL